MEEHGKYIKMNELTISVVVLVIMMIIVVVIVVMIKISDDRNKDQMKYMLIMIPNLGKT